MRESPQGSTNKSEGVRDAGITGPSYTMIIIGELINSTRVPIKKAIEEKNVSYIQDIARKQAEYGADYIDVNAGAFVYEEVEHLVWLTETVQEAVDKPLALDSPRAEALMEALKVHRGTPLINSITAEKERYEAIVPLVKQYNARVLALCMGDAGMPETAAERLDVAGQLMADLERDGVAPGNIFFDPLIKPISVDGEFAFQALETIAGIAGWNKGVHITCGLSNISFGLPHRSLLNRAFLVMAMERGLDSVLVDPLDREMIKLIKAAEVLLNRDAYGAEYLKASRAGLLE